MTNLTHCLIEARCGNFGATYSIWTPTLTGGDFDTYFRNQARKIARERLTKYVSSKGFAAKRITTKITHLNMQVRRSRGDAFDFASIPIDVSTIRAWN